MKTIREWLEELPEPYRTQALENMKNDSGEPESKNKASSACVALSCAFHWSQSPEGFNYWDKLYETLN